MYYSHKNQWGRFHQHNIRIRIRTTTERCSLPLGIMVASLVFVYHQFSCFFWTDLVYILRPLVILFTNKCTFLLFILQVTVKNATKQGKLILFYQNNNKYMPKTLMVTFLAKKMLKVPVNFTSFIHIFQSCQLVLLT